MKECIFGWLLYIYKNESLFVHLDKGYVLVRKEARYLHLQQRQVMLSSFHRGKSHQEIETVATGDFSSFCVGY